MVWPFRVTPPLLEVVEVLLDAGSELHGWAIMKETRRSGPTVYQVLERLRKADWVEWRWEDPGTREARDRLLSCDAGPGDPGEAGPPENTPRRRYYRLSGEGASKAPVLLAERGRLPRDLRRPAEVPGMAAMGQRIRFHLGGAG
jgi:PadR family transcriptional regulator, regulatory protein PadR